MIIQNIIENNNRIHVPFPHCGDVILKADYAYKTS